MQTIFIASGIHVQKGILAMSIGSLADNALKDLKDEFPEVTWTTGIIILLVSLITVIGNGLVLASILLDPFKNIRRSPTSNLIFSLAVADFMMGLITGPLAAVLQIYIATNNTQLYSSNVVLVPSVILVGVSLFSLVALSVDRWIAISTPLQCAYRVTKKKTRIAIVCTWCYFFFAGIMWTMLPFNKSLLDIIVSAHMAIASILLAVLNVAVIRSVRTQAFNIKNAVNSENPAVIQNAFKREKAVTQTIVLMVTAFKICFWPHTIVLFISNNMLKLTDLHDFKIFLWMYFVSDILVFANSLMNPFLCAWRLQKYRKAFRYTLVQLKKNICDSKVQTRSKNPRQLPDIEHNHNTPMPPNFPPDEHSKLRLKTKQEPVLCSQVCNTIGVRDKDARQPSVGKKVP